MHHWQMQFRSACREIKRSESSFLKIPQFKTPVNILRADTKNVGGVAKGEMILGLPEDRHLQVDIEEYLKEKGLAVEEVTEDVE